MNLDFAQRLFGRLLRGSILRLGSLNVQTVRLAPPPSSQTARDAAQTGSPARYATAVCAAGVLIVIGCAPAAAPVFEPGHQYRYALRMDAVVGLQGAAKSPGLLGMPGRVGDSRYRLQATLRISVLERSEYGTRLAMRLEQLPR